MSMVERQESDEAAAAATAAQTEPRADERIGEGGQSGPGGIRSVPGERGVPSVHRARSLQSRMSSMLAIGLMMALGVGLLTWYYARALTRPARALQSAQALTRQRAQGEMALPPLGPISQPMAGLAPAAASPAPNDSAKASALQALLGPAPPLPDDSTAGAASPSAVVRTPVAHALDRRLTGPAFASASSDTGNSAGAENVGSPGSNSVGSMPTGAMGNAWSPVGMSGFASNAGGRATDVSTGSGDERLARLLRPEVTPAVEARLLPTQRFLLPKGAFIDCTLETAIDSTLPGMTTCITATDTFSADGTVVLLERGTKLVGETRGEVQQGQSRIFVLWTEARTPSGVVVPLDSPGTDALGRSGLAGRVERHFWERFGAAILVSVIDGAVQAGIQSTSNGGAVIVNPSGTQDVMTEVLKGTVNIPPTIAVDQGSRIQVLVARDVDFRSVYRLQALNAVSGSRGTP